MLDISHHKPGQLVVFTGSAGSGKTLILCLTALLSIQKDDDYVLFITSEESAYLINQKFRHIYKGKNKSQQILCIDASKIENIERVIERLEKKYSLKINCIVLDNLSFVIDNLRRDAKFERIIIIEKTCDKKECQKLDYRNTIDVNIMLLKDLGTRRNIKLFSSIQSYNTPSGVFINGAGSEMSYVADCIYSVSRNEDTISIENTKNRLGVRDRVQQVSIKEIYN